MDTGTILWILGVAALYATGHWVAATAVLVLVLVLVCGFTTAGDG